MHLLLYLLSKIYGIIIDFRNYLFDSGILQEESHKTPIICIGNLSVGGSGKTPHTCYIAKLLSPKYKVAILSRGYGRKSSGFQYVDLNSTASNVGDEPLQLKINNPNCIVAVNNNRNEGVKKILIKYPDTDLILLDDGFQHRKIKAGLNIIITPFDKLFVDDKLLPLGTLREAADSAKRADIIIVSKTPKNLDTAKKKNIVNNLNLKTHQKAYFSSITYHKYKCIKSNRELKNEQDYDITLVSGIANPDPLIYNLKEKVQKVNTINFPDHHNYTAKDVENILLLHNKQTSKKKLILTTQKDATKLKTLLTNFNGENLYYIPIEVAISDKKTFEKKLLHYVTKD